ncbi:MAG: hypothetical protein ACUVSQ_06765 [Pseudanabaenaceae cyanobacterium]
MMRSLPRKRLRSLPPKQTPSSIYIRLHQLANEREHLLQERQRLESRQRYLDGRLQELSRQIDQLETAARLAAMPEVPPEASPFDITFFDY